MHAEAHNDGQYPLVTIYVSFVSIIDYGWLPAWPIGVIT